MNIGTVHLQTGEVLPYLALAYALFFIVIFTYVISMSRRQRRVQDDLTIIRRALEDEQANAAAATGPRQSARS